MKLTDTPSQDAFNAAEAADIATQQSIYANNIAFIQQLLQKYFALGQATQADQASLVLAIQAKFMQALKAYEDAAMVIEGYEADQRNQLTASSASDPVKKAVSDAYDALMTTVNDRHTALIHDQMTPSFNAVFAAFLPPVPAPVTP